MRTANFPGRKNERRIKALQRLEDQLGRGTKPSKRSHPFHNRNVALSSDDVRRMTSEADVVALRINAQARAVRTKKTRALGWSAARASYRSGKL